MMKSQAQWCSHCGWNLQWQQHSRNERMLCIIWIGCILSLSIFVCCLNFFLLYCYVNATRKNMLECSRCSTHTECIIYCFIFCDLSVQMLWLQLLFRLGLAYAGSNRDDIITQLTPVFSDPRASMEVGCSLPLVRIQTWDYLYCAFTDTDGRLPHTEYMLNLFHSSCLQCFNTVGWASGTASGLCWVMRCCHGYLSAMRCIWPSWCQYHPIISCFIKSQIGVTILVSGYLGCPGKRGRYMGVCLSVLLSST